MFRIGIKIHRQPWYVHCSGIIRSIRAASQCATQTKRSPHRLRTAKIQTTLLACINGKKPIWLRSLAAAAPMKIIRSLIWHVQIMVTKTQPILQLCATETHKCVAISKLLNISQIVAEFEIDHCERAHASWVDPNRLQATGPFWQLFWVVQKKFFIVLEYWLLINGTFAD